MYSGGVREYVGDTEVTNVILDDFDLDDEFDVVVTKIEEQAFSRCTNLTNLSFLEESAVTTLGNEAFGESGIITLQGIEGVKKIGRAAFYECVDLRTIEGLGCEEMGDYCFARCPLLQSIKWSLPP